MKLCPPRVNSLLKWTQSHLIRDLNCICKILSAMYCNIIMTVIFHHIHVLTFKGSGLYRVYKPGSRSLGSRPEISLPCSDPYMTVSVSHVKWCLVLLTWIAVFFLPPQYFCFELTIYRLTRSCKTVAERGLLYPSWYWIFQSKNWKFSPMVTSYINIVHYQNQEGGQLALLGRALCL